MTLSNVLGPTERDCRCFRLNDSDCEESGGEAVEFGVGIDPGVVADEAETGELAERTFPSESGEM